MIAGGQGVECVVMGACDVRGPWQEWPLASDGCDWAGPEQHVSTSRWDTHHMHCTSSKSSLSEDEEDGKATSGITMSDRRAPNPFISNNFILKTVFFLSELCSARRHMRLGPAVPFTRLHFLQLAGSAPTKSAGTLISGSKLAARRVPCLHSQCA